MKDDAPMLRTMGKPWLIMLPFFYVCLSPINIQNLFRLYLFADTLKLHNIKSLIETLNLD